MFKTTNSFFKTSPKKVSSMSIMESNENCKYLSNKSTENLTSDMKQLPNDVPKKMKVRIIKRRSSEQEGESSNKEPIVLRKLKSINIKNL
jgi:hypothetical protein